jgi:hypothetical protein
MAIANEPKLLTTDSRLARIEDLLIRISMRLDKVETSLSNLSPTSAQRRRTGKGNEQSEPHS